MTQQLNELRTLLELAKEIRGSTPFCPFDKFDQTARSNLLVEMQALKFVQSLKLKPMNTMTMLDAYALGALITFLNLEIERLEELYEAQAKP